MNQKELIAAIAAHGHEKKTVDAILVALGTVTYAELQKGGEVTLPGIGKIALKHREARTGRNPRTGEAVEIAAKRVPDFTAAKALKDAVA